MSLAVELPRGLREAPVGPAYVYGELLEHGIGQVVVTREAEDGRLVTGFFLVDMFCLGVKDAFAKVFRRTEFKMNVVPRLLQPMRPVEPAYAAALLEQAVAYAASLGLSPHGDYVAARTVLDGIDTSHCHETFTFGENGKPNFIPGPNMTPWESRQIMQTLIDRLGPDGFHFLAEAHQVMD